ncbi:MAG: hypothetical protein XD50_0736 [Clostridia bacterium 41_269]|nr:MAG: hypothetical protein XD50_0736 [Clostridia bacterium 41_269]
MKDIEKNTEKLICPQCGYTIKDVKESLRCPRCNALLVEITLCQGSCRNCSIKMSC